MKQWIQIPPTEIRAFLTKSGIRRTGPHNWKPIKRMPWPVCRNCGLLRLRNPATQKAANALCVYEDDE